MGVIGGKALPLEAHHFPFHALKDNIIWSEEEKGWFKPISKWTCPALVPLRGLI